MPRPAPDVVLCELCALPHRAGDIRCTSCEHRLGTQPDWDALRAELPALKQGVLLGVLALVGVIALNVVIFGGAGYVIVLAPIGWILRHGLRYRTLSARLRNAR